MPGAEYYPKEEKDIKSRGPFGKWPKDDEAIEHNERNGHISPNPEDDLIAKIDRAIAGETNEDDTSLVTESPKKSRSSDSFDTEFDELGQSAADKTTESVEPDESKSLSQQSQRQPERRDKTYNSLSQKVYPSSEQKSKNAQIRKHRKLKHK